MNSNEIIILGNGFDLAHGLKTSYFDFAEWLKENISKSIMNIFLNNDENNIVKQEILENFKNTQSWYIHYNLKKLDYALKLKDSTILLEEIKTNPQFLKKVISNNLILDLYDSNGENWADIENFYFNQLVELANAGNSESTKLEIRKLNRDFSFLKKKLIEYLKGIELKVLSEVQMFFLKQFKYAKKVLIIDFNYTEAIKQYLTPIHNLIILNIHGTLKDGNIIFGYGNDQDLEYQKLKSLENNDILEHMKTIEYLMDSSYQKLLSQLETLENYTVNVIGHSLSLTDKTLLSEIFENKNCKMIKLYKRKSDDKDFIKAEFKKSLKSITRIISKENLARKKVNNFKVSKSFP